MPLLLSPWKRTHNHPEKEQPVAVAEIERPDPASTVDRLLVLRPTESGLAFRMYGFPDADSAREYLESHLWLEAHSGLRAFWALHQPPAPNDPADAVVIIRDPYHTGVVQAYSFIDMDAALAFVRDEFRNGIDLNLVLVFWMHPVPIDLPSALAQETPPERAFFATPVLDRHIAALPPEARPNPVIRVDAIAPKPAAQNANGKAAEAQAGTDGDAAKEPSWLSQMTHRAFSWPGWDGLAPLLFRALRLDSTVFAATESDPHATGRARLMLAVAVFLAGFSALDSGLASAFRHVIFAAAGWTGLIAVIYVFSVAVVGVRTRPGAFKRLVQTVGLAAAPALFLVFGIIPVYGAIAVLGVYIWVFLTTVHAITPALDLDDQTSVVAAAFGALTLFAVAQVAPLVLY